MSKWRRNKSLTRRWQRNFLINRFGAICILCGKPFKSMKDMTFDHILPVSKGGLDEISNYGLAHLECNNLKSDMTMEEFQKFQKGGELVE